MRLGFLDNLWVTVTTVILTLLAARPFLPAAWREYAGFAMFLCFTTGVVVTLLYNKFKRGAWFPGARKGSGPST
jgi:hypothetical protein